MNASRFVRPLSFSLTLGALALLPGRPSEACEHGVANATSDAGNEKAQAVGVKATPTLAKALRERCDGKGEFSFSATGTGFEAYEGKRVWLSVLERDRWTPRDPGVVVLLEGRIHRGSFAFRCEKTLHKTFAYPAFALLVDTNDDGRCSPTDLARNQELYGWNSDMSHAFLGAEIHPVQQISTVVGDRKQFSFCKLYFPPSTTR